MNIAPYGANRDWKFSDEVLHEMGGPHSRENLSINLATLTGERSEGLRNGRLVGMPLEHRGCERHHVRGQFVLNYGVVTLSLPECF